MFISGMKQPRENLQTADNTEYKRGEQCLKQRFGSFDISDGPLYLNLR